MLLRSHQVTATVEKVADESMHGQESPRLPGRGEPSHVPLALPCRLVGDVGPVSVETVRMVERVPAPFGLAKTSPRG